MQQQQRRHTMRAKNLSAFDEVVTKNWWLIFFDVLTALLLFIVQGLIQLLRSEGVELWDLPNPPVERHKVSKSRKPIKVDDTTDWTDYV